MTEEGIFITPEQFKKLPQCQKLDIIYTSLQENSEISRKNKVSLVIQSWIIGVLSACVGYLGILHLH